MSIFPAQLLADNIDTVVILYPAAILGQLVITVEAVQFAEGFLSLACSLIEYIETDQSFSVAVQFTQHFLLLAIYSHQKDQVEQN